MAFDQLREGVIAVSVIVFTVVALLLAVNALRDDRLDAIGATTTNNESYATTNNTAISLANNYVNSIVLVQINNTGTFRTVTEGTNYTFDNSNREAAPTITFKTWVGGAGQNVTRITYTYIDEYGSVASNVTLQGKTGLYNSTTLMPTIGLLLGVVALIGIVIGLFIYVKD